MGSNQPDLVLAVAFASPATSASAGTPSGNTIAPHSCYRFGLSPKPSSLNNPAAHKATRYFAD
jgi:hypothetical protein